MTVIIRFVAAFLGITLLAIFNIGLSYILPYPWSMINVLFLALVMIILIWESGFTVWIAFISHFLIELYGITPFGIVLFSSTVSILIGYWLYINTFTNRSWYTAIVLTFFIVVIYRLLYITLFNSYLFYNSLDLPNASFYGPLLWEILLTTLGAGIVYFIFSLFSDKLKPSSSSF